MIESWTGSEHQRRPQGTCLPPSRLPDTTPRFRIPAGVPCEVRPVVAAKWRPHRTTRETGFERYERAADGWYEFRNGGWMIRVRCRDVVHRNV